MRRVSAALLALLLNSCSLLADRPLRFSLGVESLQLDWTRAIDATSAVVLDNVMEGLTSYADSLGGAGAELPRPAPALAFSWSVSEGGRVYRFHLRPGVFWSDGVGLEASHFVDSWRRLLDPATASASSYQLFEVENAAAFAAGKLKDFSRVGVRALDSQTLEVRLRRPVPYFLHLMALPPTFPIRMDLVRKYGDQWTDPERLVTLGPYSITEWSPGERLVLQAYPRYHGPRPSISTVICRLVAEPLTAYALYENDELDILPRDLPPSFARSLQSRPDYRSGPKLAVSFLLFNVNRPPFDSAERRRSFIRAMNRESLAAFFGGSMSPFAAWVPPGLPGYAPTLGIPSAEQPYRLRSSATLSLRFSGSDTWNLVSQAIQRSMGEKLQVKARLERVESGEFQKFLAQLSARPRLKAESLPHLLLMGWVADYPDPHTFMNIFTSTSENNYMGWRDPSYDELVEKAVSTEDEGARRRYYAEAQRLLLEKEAVLMPLFLGSHQALVRPSLRGVRLNVLDKWYFRRMEFSDGAWRGFGRGVLRRIRSAGGAGSS